MQDKMQGRRTTMDAAVERARAELPAPAYMDVHAAAAYLSLTRKKLEGPRTLGCGPRYSKLGRLVRYARVELDAWMAARTVANTAQEVPR